ncbi:MAG: hypothetical protein GTN74_09430 [Proteobacteria bacterium]|nr:hypothetical protein [Pseudomonadota bacterium]NIS70225.1 hypothetical protein [Pseudomonadota bacterium]
MRLQNWVRMGFAVLCLMSFIGCYRSATKERVNVAEIPDRVYEIYVHSFTPESYAVLLDIPNDGKRVFMRHTDRTERVGMDRPGPYVDEMQRRINGFRSAIVITDEEGFERGYLMVSPVLSYTIQRYQNEIKISIWKPALDEELGPRLHPGIFRNHPSQKVR